MLWKNATSISIPWNKYPFVRLLLPFILGILFAKTWVLDLNLRTLGFALILLLGFYFMHRLAKKKAAYRTYFGIGMFFVYFLMGNTWAHLRNERFRPNHFKENQTVELVARVDYIEEKQKYWDSYSTVLHEVKPDTVSPKNGLLLLRFPKSSSYVPGSRDIVQVKINLLTPDHASAPFEFDWNDLLASRNIHQIAYVDTTLMKIVHDAPENWLERFRATTDQLIQEIFDSDRDYPVASAMLIGLRKKMDTELYKAYSATGAVHVLAVSGMHVGIIVSILELLLGYFLSKNRRSMLFKGLALISIIWIYTFITGSTPSIQRAASMFSLFIFARYMQRDASPLNILAGVAFVLLLLNPFDIYNIGFQLSFGAMMGIFILYEPIRTLITPTGSVTQILWKILAISFSAQLMIYPVVGYHFHQFAFFFWLTSLITSYLAYVIILGGMIALPIFYFKILFLKWLALPLVYAVRWMNNSIDWIFHLPLGRVGGWWPSIIDCILLITVSITFGNLLKEKSASSIKPFFLFLCLTIGCLIVEEVINQNKSEIIASYNRGHPIVWVKDHQTVFQVTTDSLLPSSNYAAKYHLKSFIPVSPGYKYQTGNTTITADSIHFEHGVYTWLDHRTDTIPSLSNHILFVLTRHWNNTTPAIYPDKIFILSIKPYTTLDKISTRSQIIHTKNPYLQVALK